MRLTHLQKIVTAHNRIFWQQNNLEFNQGNNRYRFSGIDALFKIQTYRILDIQVSSSSVFPCTEDVGSDAMGTPGLFWTRKNIYPGEGTLS